MVAAVQDYRYSRLRIHFFEVDVPTVAAGRIIYFPMRTLCKVIGLAAQMQVNKLRSDPRFAEALRDLPIPTVKGERIATCIRKQDVSRWLSEIEPSRCSITARGPLEQFQRELFDAADRWLFGDNTHVVYDAGAKSNKPVTGTLHLGDCPRCGLALCLVMDETGAHLAPGGKEEDS